MNDAFFEEEQLAGLERATILRLVQPERALAGKDVEIFIAGRVIMRGRRPIDTENPRTGRFFVGQISVQQQSVGF